MENIFYFGGVVATVAVAITISLIRVARKEGTDLKTIRKKAAEGVEFIGFLVEGFFSVLAGVVVFLLGLYAVIWLIKRMWEAA